MAKTNQDKKFNELFNCANDAIFLFKLASRGWPSKFIEVNDAACQRLRYTRNELLKMSPLDISPDLNRTRLSKIMKILKIKKRTTFETIHLAKDGTHIPVEVSSRIFFLNNQTVILSIARDITERKQAQEALKRAKNELEDKVEKRTKELKKSETKYKNLIANAEAGMAILNSAGFITYANRTLLKILGYSGQKLANIHFAKIIHPQDKKMVTDRFRKRISGKKIIPNYEFRIITKTQKIKFISFSGAAIIEQGRVAGVQAIIKDITENKKLQDKIEQSKKHYEHVIDTIQDGIVVINTKYQVVSCNKIFADKTGRQIKNIINKYCHKILALYEKNILKNTRSEKIIDKICGPASVFKLGKAISFIEKYEDKDRGDHYHIISIYPDRDTKGKIYQIVVTIRDITGQKRAEEEIRRLSEFNQRILNTSPVSIAVLDRKGYIISANALANGLMGKGGLKVVGRKLITTKEINNNPYLIKLYDALLKKAKPFYFDNLSYISEDTGTKKYLNIIAVPLLNKARQVEGAISMAVDNTESVKNKQKLEYLNQNLETKVIERTRELDTTNKKLGQVLNLKLKFIADASHELRTPLTVVQGNLDLAIREAENSKCKIPDLYYTIIEEVGRMSSILSDLTLLTNLDSRNEQIYYENINLGQLIKSVGMSLKVIADQKKISLIYDQGAKKIKICGDEAKLEKLLLNIVRNAIKYTERKGQVRIWVEAKDDEAIINVRDNGLGIPKKDLPFIFERFYRVDKARSRSEGGSGLGLSIAKFIADAHQGKINVTSTEGKGSTFSIHLPYNYKKHRQ